VELLNEPRAPGVSLKNATKYYKAAYDAIRKHSSTAYVVMCNRLGEADPKELFPLASGFTKPVIDFHYYEFDNMTIQQNLEFVQTNRTAQLTTVTKSNGPGILVGM
jgi:hypothetical protein